MKEGSGISLKQKDANEPHIDQWEGEERVKEERGNNATCSLVCVMVGSEPPADEAFSAALVAK